MDRHSALPHLVEIAAFRRVGSADRNDLKAAFPESRGERTPAGGSPLLVSEHRGGVDHRIGARRNRLERRRRRTHHLGHARNAERVGEPQHLLDAVNGCHGGRAAVKHAALDQVAEPGPVRIGQSGVGSSGQHGKERGAVTGLGRDRQVISLEQSRHERGCLGNRRPRRATMTRSTSGLPSMMPAGPGYQHVDSHRARPAAGCGSAVSSAARRQCAAARPPECVNGPGGRAVAAEASRAFYSHWTAFQIRWVLSCR